MHDLSQLWISSEGDDKIYFFIVPDIGKSFLHALVHVAQPTNEGRRQDNSLSSVYRISISIHSILQRFVVFGMQFALVHSKEQQPLPFNLGIRIC